MANTPSPNQLRQLIFKFYNENDPAKVQMGLDINGIVEWTMRNGVDALNEMLYKQFKKTIDVNEKMGDAKEKFNRMSLGLTFSTQIAKKETEYRIKLHTYFSKHDPSMLESGKEPQFEKFVKFAMLNGFDKLNEKLQQKYKAGVDDGGNGGAARIASTADSEVDRPVNDLGAEGDNPYGLDVDRLKEDLELFYEEMQDEEQLEVLEDITTWACQIGMDEFNDKIEQMYGTSLNEFLKEEGRPTHANNEKPSAKTGNIEAAKPKAVQNVMAVPQAQAGGGVKEFEDMTDEEIKAELSAFYNKHDPDNLEKLDQVCELARRLGRADLNAKLKEIYGDELTPPPKPPGLGFGTGLSTRLNANDVNGVKFQDDAESEDEGENDVAPPPMPPRNDSDWHNADDGIDTSTLDKMEEQANVPSLPARDTPRGNPYDSTPIVLPAEDEGPKAGGNLMDDLKDAVKTHKPNASMEEQLATERNDWRGPPPVKENLFQKLAREKMERNRGGRSRVTGDDGKVHEINILIDACTKYRLDVFTGICVCGFTKADHSKASKYKVNAGLVE